MNRMRAHQEVPSAEHTIGGNVRALVQLRGEDGQFFTGTVNVAGYVSLHNLDLDRLPVRFGAVGGDFDCSDNWLTTLEGAPHTVGGHFYCSRNRLSSLVGVHRILRRVDGELYIWGNEIEAGGIGLILVEGLVRIHAVQPVFKIIGQYLGQGKPGLLRCQEALHEAGFAEFAKL